MNLWTTRRPEGVNEHQDCVTAIPIEQEIDNFIKIPAEQLIGLDPHAR